MFHEEIRIKQGLSYISFCPSRIHYNSKFILMSTSLETNDILVTRAHCTVIIFYYYFVGLSCNLEMAVMLDCLKAHNFNETQCAKEIVAFNKCVEQAKVSLEITL